MEKEEELFNYLNNKEYPKGSSKDDKRKLRSIAKKYVIKERKWNWINHNKELREVSSRKSDKTIILEMFHNNKSHLGIEKNIQCHLRNLSLEKFIL